MTETETSNWATQVQGLALLRATGPDAQAFLQGQLSNDVAALAKVGDVQLSSWSNARGRVFASFLLVRDAGDGFTLVCPRELAQDLEHRLRMYVLRSKVKIELLPSAPVGLVGAEAIRGAGLSAAAADDIVWQGAPAAGAQDVLAVRWADRQPRCLLIGAGAARLMVSLPPQPEHAWWDLDVAAAIPWITSTATREQFVAQMLNLDRLGALNFQKGCFLGQEVIARTHYLGRVKRRLGRYRPAHAAATGPATPGVAVEAQAADGTWSEAGTVVNVASNGDLLAVLQTDAAPRPLRLAPADAAVPLTPLPLPYDL